jgi:hypothetical protein
MKRIVLPLAVFFLYLVVIGIGSTFFRFAKTADLALLSLHLGFLTVFSMLVVRDRWMGAASSGERVSILRRIRRWVTDERPDSSRRL